eukprot:TRINITY_DN6701_c0_g1_i2.p1 TRINITY_DN6701_c0_g1~~TRINITY_DN6701_c0_g1_i2.p1  ORF type:complete len:110 (+),score=24.29 TRINITY_DN6701_c0_g1_i2:155-484(+)
MRKQSPPSSSVITSLDNVAITKLLSYFLEWLTEGEDSTQKPTISQNTHQWLYSLLLVLDSPLLDDSASVLSKFLSLCCTLRSLEQTDADIASVNIIYTIISKFFGQTEQ